MLTFHRWLIIFDTFYSLNYLLFFFAFMLSFSQVKGEKKKLFYCMQSCQSATEFPFILYVLLDRLCESY